MHIFAPNRGYINYCRKRKISLIFSIIFHPGKQENNYFSTRFVYSLVIHICRFVAVSPIQSNTFNSKVLNVKKVKFIRCTQEITKTIHLHFSENLFLFFCARIQPCPVLCNDYICILYIFQLTIKISEIRLRRFGIILTPLSSRNKDNGRVSNLNTNKGDRVC